MRTFTGIADLADAAGTHLGVSDWITVTQERIDAFAAATGDDQWIHTDPVRAADGPFGTTIAHGLLTLSLVPALIAQVYTVENVVFALNYGSNTVRYPAPVPSGSRVRASVDLVSVTPTPRGTQSVVRATVEVEGSAKPACVAEMVVLLIG